MPLIDTEALMKMSSYFRLTIEIVMATIYGSKWRHGGAAV